MNEKNYYKILGVAENAGDDDIKKAYRSLAKKYHPDRNTGNKQAEERFKEINEAYGVLSDPDKRRQYDQLRKYGAGQFGGQNLSWEDLARQFGGAQGAGPFSGRGFDFSNFGRDFSFGDLFSSFFDQGESMRRRQAGPQSGADIEAEATIPFQTAVEGGQIQVTVPKESMCPTCNGTAAEPGTKAKTCDLCAGRGVVSEGRGGFSISRPCPRCMGRGKIVEHPCHTCNGTGTVSMNRTISVPIPAGIESGTTLRLRGEGNAGYAGGPTGGLHLTVRVEEDRFFERKGANVYAEVPLNIAQAILGTKIRIRTPQGQKVLLKIPAGTDSGHTFRLKGMGIESRNAVGDMFVTVKIQTPKDISNEQRELIKKFAQSAGMKH